MDYKVIWTDEALEDIEKIAEYIERDFHYYASCVVTKILETTGNLSIYLSVFRPNSSGRRK